MTIDDYLQTVDVWAVLDLIVAEFESDPRSVQCFDARLVKRAIALNRERRQQTDALRAVVTSLVGWARERIPSYPFDHNGECLFCDEMGEHAPDCAWPIVAREDRL